jgi:hypothetical protein
MLAQPAPDGKAPPPGLANGRARRRGDWGAVADGWARGGWEKGKRWFNFKIQKLGLSMLQKSPKFYWSKIKLPITQCNNENSKAIIDCSQKFK